VTGIVIPEGIPNRTKWCQICGRYSASPVDPLILRQMLEAKGVPEADKKVGQAHPGCYHDLKIELGLE
jgi:hypothetical protein